MYFFLNSFLSLWWKEYFFIKRAEGSVLFYDYHDKSSCCINLRIHKGFILVFIVYCQTKVHLTNLFCQVSSSVVMLIMFHLNITNFVVVVTNMYEVVIGFNPPYTISTSAILIFCLKKKFWEVTIKLDFLLIWYRLSNTSLFIGQ